MPGYPEYYLDIKSSRTVSIIESMIDHQCAAKRFDAVETDIDDEYTDATGFGLTKAIEERYMTILADYMHGLGLGWWIKNPDDTGDSYATDMYGLADAVLTEQCNQYSTCVRTGGLRAPQGGIQRRVQLENVPVLRSRRLAWLQWGGVQRRSDRRPRPVPVALRRHLGSLAVTVVRSGACPLLRSGP